MVVLSGDVFRTCNNRRLLILQMGVARQYMHIPGIVEKVAEQFERPFHFEGFDSIH